ncbi:MAG: outer membrane beta-barrel protein [Candidatus Binatia bacterium]
MRKELFTSIVTLGLLAGATTAFAGAYGEDVEAVEAPVSPPAVVEVAEVTVDYAALGPYIGVGGLYAVELFDDQGSARTGNSGGFNVHAGYRFHAHAAAELRYEYYHRFDLDPGHIDAWSTTINLKGYLLTGRFQPYGLIGMGYLSGEGSAGNFAGAAHPSNGFALRFGGGLDGYITEHISVGPEFAFLLPTGSANDLDMFTVGFNVQYKF